MTEPLDAARLRLRGSGLIEASAGTGKTWTLAALFLRLVLGHGDAVQREGRALLPGEILVMTFTRAATRELGDRIRARLVGAARVFRGSAPVPQDDPFLAALLADQPTPESRELAAWRLDVAAQGMDEAAIHTLDAWCQRVLRDNAIEHDSVIDGEVLPDSHALSREAAQDVWRQQVYPLPVQALEAVRRLWPTPQQLAQDAQQVLEQDLPANPPGIDVAAIIERGLAELAELKRHWAQRADEMEDWLQPLLQLDDSPFSRTRLTWEKVCDWLDALRRWAEDPLAEQPVLTEAARTNLTPAGLRASLKKNRSAPTPPECFDHYLLLMQALQQLHSREPQLRAHLAAAVIARMQQLKAQRQLHSHHDVQQALHDALDESRHGERARRLRQRILERYPAALIDEFQDTSPRQLGILDRLYRVADDEPSRLLLLIGDPKQSIYAFRGADIHSYLQARDATAGRLHLLGVNHRSTAAMVEAVNAIFELGESRPGDGAFRFGDGLAGRRLPFEPARAAGRAEALHCGGQALPALLIGLDSRMRSVVETRRAMAQRCAQAIVRLLGAAQAAFARPGEAAQALRPGDVAVLVRSRSEAALVRAALAERGLPSVFLSDRDSVFATAEAADVLRWLQAVAAPRDARRVRAALATSLLGLELPELQALADDDERFERQAERFLRLQAVWQGQGVLALLRTMLHEWGLPARWLAGAEGERRLTHVLHLAELLQEASTQLEGPSALLRWMARQIADPEGQAGAGDERVLRLESDADRVQVVTIHKSKGLEYPVVFLPFASFFRDAARHAPWALQLVDDSGQRRLVLDPGKEERQRAELEQQREDLRLLYVALTRARHHLWLGASLHTVGQGKGTVWHRSALGYLISGEQPRAAAEAVADLQHLAACVPSLQLQHWSEADDPALQPPQRWQAASREPPLAPPRAYVASFDRLWGISSYSALVRDAAVAERAAAAPPSSDALGLLGDALLRLDEPDLGAGAGATAPQDLQAGEPWHRFPRGALAGQFLHGQLEWLAGESFALAANPALQQALAQRCEREGWGHRQADVQDWLAAVCCRRLPPLGCALSDLQGCLPEMEFWLPSDGLDATALDEQCRRSVLPGQARPALVPRQLRGLLMGFADLVFEHQGRWWVLDYKSNALGADDAAYTESAMQAAVLEHRYDVQAVLYLLPLHRLLRARLGADYDPARQLGGAIYLFLRGIGSARAGCLSLEPPWPLLQALDRQLPGTR